MSYAAPETEHEQIVAAAVSVAWDEATERERERCARIVETALREDYKRKTGQERSLSEAEVFLAAAIRRNT